MTFEEFAQAVGTEVSEWQRYREGMSYVHWTGVDIAYYWFALNEPLKPELLVALKEGLNQYVNSLDVRTAQERKSRFQAYQNARQFLSDFNLWLIKNPLPVATFLENSKQGDLWAETKLTDAVPQEMRKRFAESVTALQQWEVFRQQKWLTWQMANHRNGSYSAVVKEI